jgi:hypothetical protein
MGQDRNWNQSKYNVRLCYYISTTTMMMIMVMMMIMIMMMMIIIIIILQNIVCLKVVSYLYPENFLSQIVEFCPGTHWYIVLKIHIFVWQNVDILQFTVFQTHFIVGQSYGRQINW